MYATYHDVELCDEGSVIYVYCHGDLVLTEQERRAYLCWILGV